MPPDSRNADLITRAMAANERLRQDLAELVSLTDAIREILQTSVEAPFEAPSNAPKTRDAILAEHRRAHRMGLPSKIESDPELEAFILARIDTLTYAQVIDAVKAHFPADRHTSVAAVQRWFKKRAARGGQRRQLNRL